MQGAICFNSFYTINSFLFDGFLVISKQIYPLTQHLNPYYYVSLLQIFCNVAWKVGLLYEPCSAVLLSHAC